MRTEDVSSRTTLLLTRNRFHVDLPGRESPRQLVAEDAQVVGFRGPADAPDWLTDAEVAEALRAVPSANIPSDQARDLAERVIDRLDSLTEHLDARASAQADGLLESHRRVRVGAGATRRGLAVRAQTPVDVLGVYVYLPAVTG